MGFAAAACLVCLVGYADWVPRITELLAQVRTCFRCRRMDLDPPKRVGRCGEPGHRECQRCGRCRRGRKDRHRKPGAGPLRYRSVACRTTCASSTTLDGGCRFVAENSRSAQAVLGRSGSTAKWCSRCRGGRLWTLEARTDQTPLDVAQKRVPKTCKQLPKGSAVAFSVCSVSSPKASRPRCGRGRNAPLVRNDLALGCGRADPCRGRFPGDVRRRAAGLRHLQGCGHDDAGHPL